MPLISCVTLKDYRSTRLPWLDAKGRVVDFAGRCLVAATKGVDRKYLNSPESMIYHKSEELYGLYQAIPAIREKDCVYVVEGYLDVISLYSIGIKNVVANSGTWLSSAQVQLLMKFKKYGGNPNVGFDRYQDEVIYVKP